jgi:FkbH-like protein
VADKFGDHGLISLAIAVPGASPGDLDVDTWLMSCRVIGRTVEELQFNLLLEHAEARGFRRLVGLYIPTPKNPLVEGLYDRLGFTRAEERADKSVRYELAVAGAKPALTFVRTTRAVQSS